MNILVTNDDGIYARSMWTLVKELLEVGNVTVVAPDREQSAIGTALTLRMPLRVQRIEAGCAEHPVGITLPVETWAVEGTPGDAVIMALAHLVKVKIDLVVSGINAGPNIGDDVLISGTVGAALQGFERGLPAIAVSLASRWDQHEDLNDGPVAKVAALIAKRFKTGEFSGNMFLNLNAPDLPLDGLTGMKVTHLANETHIETVEEGNDGKRAYYWLIRKSVYEAPVKGTDIHAIEGKSISVTNLHTFLSRRRVQGITDADCVKIFAELKNGASAKAG
jgi:5'-nucleotidase